METPVLRYRHTNGPVCPICNKDTSTLRATSSIINAGIVDSSHAETDGVLRLQIPCLESLTVRPRPILYARATKVQSDCNQTAPFLIASEPSGLEHAHSSLTLLFMFDLLPSRRRCSRVTRPLPKPL
ncbi:unnamed protein product, partial [Ectocarpus sp. 13 AM-2016]